MVAMSLGAVLVLLLLSSVCGMAALIGVGAIVGQAMAQTFNLPMIVVLHVDGRDFPLAWSLAWASLLGALLLRFARPGWIR